METAQLAVLARDTRGVSTRETAGEAVEMQRSGCGLRSGRRESALTVWVGGLGTD